MESGAIPDSNITASTIKAGFDAWGARLNKNSCWIPAQHNDTEYIEVSFTSMKTVVAIATQGAPNKECWVNTFTLQWYDNGVFIKGHKVKIIMNMNSRRLLCLAYNFCEWTAVMLMLIIYIIKISIIISS